MSKKNSIGEFLKWYEEEFSSGDLNTNNYSECAVYLQGLCDSSEKKYWLNRCISTLHGGARLIEQLKLESMVK